MIRLRQIFRRWLFRRLFPDYKSVFRLPKNNQTVFILDSSNKIPIWICDYDTKTLCFYTHNDDGWFEFDEIDYWAPCS